MRTWQWLMWLIMGVSVSAQAQAPRSASTPAPPSSASRQPNDMVEWVEPPLATNKPQTDAEAEHGRQMGRSLPAPEVLQPTLDPALPAYRPRTNGKLSGHFKGAASDVLPSLVRLWVESFERIYPEVHIDVPPPYAGSLGAKELVNGSLDFVFVSRELRPDDITDFKTKFGYEPLSVPVSGGSYRHFGFLDAIVFFVNRRNPIETITFGQLDGILSSSRNRGGPPITTWRQLGVTGDWADKPIHAYGIQPWNGFEEYVRQRVLSVDSKRGEWRDDLHFDKVVFPIAARVANDPYGIGYSGVSYIDAPVKVLALRVGDSGPFYPPTYDNVARMTYPLSRLIYFNLNQPPGKPLDPALEEFLRFVLSRDGQEIVVRHAIFLPLRAEQATRAVALLNVK